MKSWPLAEPWYELPLWAEHIPRNPNHLMSPKKDATIDMGCWAARKLFQMLELHLQAQMDLSILKGLCLNWQKQARNNGPGPNPFSGEGSPKSVDPRTKPWPGFYCQLSPVSELRLRLNLPSTGKLCGCRMEKSVLKLDKGTACTAWNYCGQRLAAGTVDGTLAIFDSPDPASSSFSCSSRVQVGIVFIQCWVYCQKFRPFAGSPSCSFSSLFLSTMELEAESLHI